MNTFIKAEVTAQQKLVYIEAYTKSLERQVQELTTELNKKDKAIKRFYSQPMPKDVKQDWVEYMTSKDRKALLERARIAEERANSERSLRDKIFNRAYLKLKELGIDFNSIVFMT